MLEIARALAEHARVIVLDEPTAALTEAEAERLFALVRERRAAGTSFIYISHRLDEIQALCRSHRRDARRRARRPVRRRDDDRTTRSSTLMTGKRALATSQARQRVNVVSRRPVARSRRRAVLDVEHLSIRRSDDRRVVDDLSFTVRAGEVVALAGAWARAAPPRCRRCSASRAARSPARSRSTASPSRSARRADAINAGFAFVPEDRKAQGLVLGLSRRREPRAVRARPHVAGSASSTARAPSKRRSHVFAISPSRCRVSAPRSRPSPAAISRRS